MSFRSFDSLVITHSVVVANLIKALGAKVVAYRFSRFFFELSTQTGLTFDRVGFQTLAVWPHESQIRKSLQGDEQNGDAQICC